MIDSEIFTTKEIIAREIRARMARAELTQQDLAQIIASSQSAVSERLRGKKEFTLDELLAIAGAMGISLRELLGENIVNAKLPAPSYIEANGQGKKKVAPIGFIYKGATYEIVPEQKVPWLVGSVGLEPTTKGLSDPAYPGHNPHHSPTPGLLFCPATLKNTSHHISYIRSPHALGTTSICLHYLATRIRENQIYDHYPPTLDPTPRTHLPIRDSPDHHRRASHPMARKPYMETHHPQKRPPIHPLTLSLPYCHRAKDGRPNPPDPVHTPTSAPLPRYPDPHHHRRPSGSSYH